MAFVTKTLNAAAGAGYVLPVGNALYVDALAKAEMFVKPVFSVSTPTAPAATPAPAAGATADYFHLAASGEKLTLDFSKGGSDRGSDYVSHLLIWAVAAGELIVSAH